MAQPWIIRLPYLPAQAVDRASIVRGFFTGIITAGLIGLWLGLRAMARSTSSSVSSGRSASSRSTKNAAAPPNGESIEKTQEDFSGNVEVNDKLPAQKAIDACAKLLVHNEKGDEKDFKGLYCGKDAVDKTLVIFVRHFFCGLCQDYLRSVSESLKPESLPPSTSIIVIGCGSPSLIPMYRDATGCPYPIYADPTRKLYDILGMTRTLAPGDKNPKYIKRTFLRQSLESIWQGLSTSKDAMKGGDWKQVGGEFLFNKEKNNVLWCHRMRNTRDHAEVEELQEILAKFSKE